MAKFYKGFSLGQWAINKSFIIEDIDVVKADIMNEIYTQLGQRVGLPRFGTRISGLIFEPNDEHTRLVVEEDIRKVISNDPRVELLSLDVQTFENASAIVAFVNVMYKEFKVSDVLKIEFGN